MPPSRELLEIQPLLSPCVESTVPQYTETKPSAELENGALREGKPPEMFSRESFGLLSQFAAVGLVSGVLPGVIYPVLQGYLNAEGTIVVSATLLVQLPWSFKVFFGILSDCFPVFGYRRRPYMLFGWVSCCIMLFYMAGLYVPPPYYGDPSMHFSEPDEWTEAQQATINKNAPDAAGQYVVPMMLAAFGYLIAEVAADAMVVEHAQREPLATRGQIQAAIHSVRMGFNAIGGLVVAVAFNGVQYGGHFDFSLTFPQMMLILGIFCLPLIPITWVFLHEDKVAEVRFSVYIRRFWEVIQQRAVYQIAAYKFFSGVFNNFNIVSSSNIKFHWVHATPFNSSIMVIVGTLVYAVTLGLTGKFGLQWNWRVSIATTVILGVIIDGFMTMLTTWDIIRNQWFWLGVPIVGYVPDGVRFIVANYVVVELIETGYEGALYGLLTTTSNLATPFGRTAAKLINSRFQVWVEDIMRDTYEVRRDVTITICICYGMKLVSLAFLPLLPRQKAETQELKRFGGKSKLMGGVTVAYLLVAMVWSTLINLLSMFEKTKCWKITGGCAPTRL
uniref:Major facilitator superfamily (MFS) profile domain-containing protein n=1 Tax=Globisporangium ultimum (strain ATCC 200006 / CBS 805.95 / DAOM BR144) TaxID=431595 RepID=K3X921_GLOUD